MTTSLIHEGFSSCGKVPTLQSYRRKQMTQMMPDLQPYRRLAERLDIHYTPKHGRWLNMAEIELIVLKGQCLDRRIPNITIMQSQVATWERNRNNRTRKIVWQFTTPDARIKLKRLCPNL